MTTCHFVCLCDSLEHWNDCVRFLSSFDGMLREIRFQLMSTRAPINVSFHLKFYNVTARLNFGLIVSDWLFSMTSGLKKALCLTSSSIMHGNSTLEHLTDSLTIIIFFDVMFEERNKFEIIFNYTVEQPFWRLDWLSHNLNYLWCHWIHLKIANAGRMKIGLIVSY